MTVWITAYKPTTLQCTGASTDAGFTTLAEVEAVMGEPLSRARRMLMYPDGVCFTDFRLHIDTGVIPVASCGNETGT